MVGALVGGSVRPPATEIVSVIVGANVVGVVGNDVGEFVTKSQ
jgi:hypothetical protein